jgi:hypothetical protein
VKAKKRKLYLGGFLPYFFSFVAKRVKFVAKRVKRIYGEYTKEKTRSISSLRVPNKPGLSKREMTAIA